MHKTDGDICPTRNAWVLFTSLLNHIYFLLSGKNGFLKALAKRIPDQEKLQEVCGILKMDTTPQVNHPKGINEAAYEAISVWWRKIEGSRPEKEIFIAVKMVCVVLFNRVHVSTPTIQCVKLRQSSGQFPTEMLIRLFGLEKSDSPSLVLLSIKVHLVDYPPM